MGAVGVEESAAVGAQHLDGFLRSDRPLARWSASAPSSVCADGVGVQILRNALGHQQQRIDHAGGQEDVEQGARRIDPEVADGRRSGALDAADEGHRHHDADRSRKEVVRRQARHLGEIAHGGFGRVELPVGIGGETGGGVPRQIGTDCRQVLRVPRQHGLEPLDGVRQDQTDGGKAQHGKGVLAPVHLVVGVYAAELVDAAARTGGEPDRARCARLRERASDRCPPADVTASRIRLKRANCNQPLADMSEFLRVKQ